MISPKNILSIGRRWHIMLGAAVLGLMLLAALLAVRRAHADPCAQTCASVTLDTADKTGDFYVNDTLVAQGANSALVGVVPNLYSRVDVRNIHDSTPEYGVVYVYADTSILVWGYNGITTSYTVKPARVYLQGYLELLCTIYSASDTDDVACRPTVDGAARDDLHAGASLSLNLPPGPHTVHIDLVGAQAGLWDPAAADYTANVTAGYTSTVHATFNKKGSLTVALSVPNALADFTIDGQPIGQQVATAQEWLSPYTIHTITAANITDPAANGVYRWKDATVVASVYPGQVRTLTLHPQKQYLMGFASIYCGVVSWQPTDGGNCSVKVDGADAGEFLPNTSGKVTAAPGAHSIQVSLTGTSSSKWRQPAPKNMQIYAGLTSYTTFIFTVLPAPPLPPPPMPYTATLSGFGQNARDIFLRGQAIGHDPHRFSKIGDSDTDNPWFMHAFDAHNYGLFDYAYLEPVIGLFGGSFDHTGQAAHVGFVSASVLDPLWSDPSLCHQGETPLACEYRTYNPSVAIIMLRTYPYPWGDAERTKYTTEMRTVIEYTISQHIVPVVSTVPMIMQSPGELMEMNQIDRDLAAQYDVPLWDLFHTTESLQNYGVGAANHLTIPPDSATTYFDANHLQYGMTHRNLESLEVLYELYIHVMH